MKKSGFTLIELLVVISIIGVLAGLILVSMSGARGKARDARRKQDISQIAKALEMYNISHDSYPTTGATGPNNGGTYSTQGGWLSDLKTEGLFGAAPMDPINVDKGPWCWSGSATKNTIYTYASDGTHFILCAWMENTADGSTLQFRDVDNPWNPSQKLYANYSYSAYNYVVAK